MCSLCVHMCSYVIVRVFIDELQFDKSYCLTSKINRNVLEYRIIRRYTNGGFYNDYYLLLCVIVINIILIHAYISES